MKSAHVSDVGAVVIAAGLSSRMGAFKPMLPLGGSTVSRRLVSTLKEAGTDPVVVVTGHRGGELEEHLEDLGVLFVRNEKFAETQMFDSARLGFEVIMGKCRRVFFTPADIPLFTADTLRALLKTDAPLVYPAYKGETGHPVLVSAEILPQITGYTGSDGLRGAFRQFENEAKKIEVPDIGITRDADTPEEFKVLEKMLKGQ